MMKSSYNSLALGATMYIDGVILFSLAVIALILWMMGYIGVYAYKHIKKDIAEHSKTTKTPEEKFNGLA